MDELQRSTVVVVGHVDHGKSTLLGRLLLETGNLPKEKLDEIEKASAEQGRRVEYAFITDQFHEERSANITIDTSQIFLNLNNRPFLLIDAPGHKEFLKNMISGTSYAQNALLMLDVAEGIREQTERHARILSFMGIRRIAVAINKMDLVHYSEVVFNEKRRELLDILSTHQVTPTVVIPVSAYHGENVSTPSLKMPWSKGPTILSFLEECQPDTLFPSEGAFCFPVQLGMENDDSPLALGRIEQGRVKVGDKVTIFPTGTSSKVEKVLRYKQSLENATAGASLALKLEGINSFARGQVILSSDVPSKATKEISCHLLWASAIPLKPGDDVSVECRSQKTEANVVELTDPVANGDISNVKLVLRGKILLSTPTEIPALSKFVVHHKGTLAGCAIVSKVLSIVLVLVLFVGSSHAYIDPGTGVTFATGIFGWILGLITVMAGSIFLLVKKFWTRIKTFFKNS